MKTHTSLHLYLHFYSLSVADEYPVIPFWYQMTYCLLLVQILYFVRLLNRVMVTGMKAGRTWVWAQHPSLLSTISSVSLRKTITDCGVIFYLHPMAYPALASYSACYQASRFVQDSSLQAFSLKGTIALTGFLANDEVIVAPSIFSK